MKEEIIEINSIQEFLDLAKEEVEMNRMRNEQSLCFLCSFLYRALYVEFFAVSLFLIVPISNLRIVRNAENHSEVKNHPSNRP